MVAAVANKTTFVNSVVVSLWNSMIQKAIQMMLKESDARMYVNGMGFRAIERATGINHNTIVNWVREAGLALPDALFS